MHIDIYARILVYRLERLSLSRKSGSSQTKHTCIFSSFFSFFFLGGGVEFFSKRLIHISLSGLLGWLYSKPSLGCHGILIFGKSYIEWRQHPGMTIAVYWDEQTKYNSF